MSVVFRNPYEAKAMHRVMFGERVIEHENLSEGDSEDKARLRLKFKEQKERLRKQRTK
jgi:hypothetical protein